jgi:hypothetical protein
VVAPDAPANNPAAQLGAPDAQANNLGAQVVAPNAQANNLGAQVVAPDAPATASARYQAFTPEETNQLITQLETELKRAGQLSLINCTWDLIFK